MKKVKELLELIIVTLILGLVVWYVFIKKPVPTIEYVYTTDTIYLRHSYKVPEPYPVFTPPIRITNYVIDSSAIENYKILLQNQDIIIAGLEDSIRIHESYLKQFPTNPKLLSLDIKKDTFRMDLLEITGYPGDWLFPIDLNYFSYRWDVLNGFTRKKVKPTLLPPTSGTPFANYYVGGGVDLWHMMPQITGRAEKQLASIRLYLDMRVGLLDINSSNLTIGAEYQIHGKKHP